jgi:hypothetical protein
MKNQFEQYYDVVYGIDSGVSVSQAMKEIIRWSMQDRTIEGVIAKNPDLEGADLSRLDTHLIIAILRSTYIIHNYLACWEAKVDEAELVLIGRSLNPRQLLRGLKRFPK